MSNVHVLRPMGATPQELLAHAYSQAVAGEIKDVVIVVTRSDGEIETAYAGCLPGDLAVAALMIEDEARKMLQIEG